MRLQEALLCVDCESLYSCSSHCPHCGSQVSYPVERALNRAPEAGGRSAGALFGHAGRSRSISLASGRAANLLQSA